MSSAKWHPFGLRLNVLTNLTYVVVVIYSHCYEKCHLQIGQLGNKDQPGFYDSIINKTQLVCDIQDN